MKCFRYSLTAVAFLVAAVDTYALNIENAASLMEKGHYAEAYVAYTNIIFASDGADVTDGNRAQSLLDAPRCLAKLKRFDEAEPLLDKAILERKEFAVHVAYSQALGELPHYGKTVKGVFSRVNEWGAPYSSVEHDRVKRLKCLKAIMPDLAKQTKLRQRWFWNEVVNALEMNGRNRGAAWKLLELTSLTEIPQVEERENWGESDFEVGPAPVDENGEPLFYGLVKSWEDAKNDGERWMFANTARAAVDDFGRRNSARSLGVFAENQFGVYRLRYEDDLKNLIGDLRSLDDDETITRLANGIKRFKLPVECNYMRMWRELGDYASIAQEYERRYQFVKACEMWKKAGKGCSHCVERISSPNVSLSGNVPVISYKKRGRFEVNFRNADELEFSLVKIDVARYLEEVKDDIKNNRKRNNYHNLWDVARFLIGFKDLKKVEKYLIGEKYSWSQKVSSPKDHFDAKKEIEVPYDLPQGDYLLEISVKGGNRIHSILRVQRLAVVKESFAAKDGCELYVVDAETGAPVKNAKVEAFLFDATPNKDRKFEYKEIGPRFIDENGYAKIPEIGGRDHYGYITITSPDGTLEVIGSYWNDHYGACNSQDPRRGVIITDRPAYRPGDTVKYKLWMRNGGYGNQNSLEGVKISLRIVDPMWDELSEKKFTLDKFGGLAGEFKIPDDAKLGKYAISTYEEGRYDEIRSTFRVEEYRKPEFEVSIDTPKNAPMLGENVSATVRAKYLWGDSVKKGVADVTVRRTPRRITWYPSFEWSWLYENGSNWYFYDADWYCGLGNLWICRRYSGFHRWYISSPAPETVVTMKNVPLDENGEVKVVWDTSLVRKLYGDDDQEYSIYVSVTDNSHRTIDATGSVIVRAEPFRVFAWTDKPHYRVGDKVSVFHHFDGLREDDVKEVRYWISDLRKEGRYPPSEASPRSGCPSRGGNGERVDKVFSASKPGQYRVSVEVTDLKGRVREGSRIIIVRGEGDDGRNYKYSSLELIPDKETYSPGDTVKLTVNADYPDSTVFYKVRNGKTRLLRLKGKTGEISIPVVESDKPNFFVEAWTISAAKYHREVRKIMVPPVDKIGKATVEIDGDPEVVKPGETVSATVKIFDEKGKAADASAVMTVYDKAIDLIAGGSNVKSLKEAFWYDRLNLPYSFLDTVVDGFYLMYLSGDKYFGPLGLWGEYGIGFSRAETKGGSKLKRSRSAAPQAEPVMECDASAACELMDYSSPLSLENGDAKSDGVRKEFADTAYWNAALEATGTQGVYRVKFKMPEDITTWNIKVWSIGLNGRVAEVATELITKKDLMLRMITPRFFTEKDEVVVSANIHNYGNEARKATVSIDLSGIKIEGDLTHRTVTIAAGGEAQADWRIKILESGRLTVRMKVADGELADGVEKSFDVVSHAIEKTESFFKRLADGSGVPQGGFFTGEKALKLYRHFGFPAIDENKMKSAAVELEIVDTLASAIDKSLDYLKYYEYECNEQTMNRFVPAAAARDILVARGFGDRLKDVDELIEKSLKKLFERQNSDGGWGWFWGSYEQSYEHMTATIVRGLAEAERHGVKVPDEVINGGVNWLKTRQKESLKYIEKYKIRPWANDVLTAYAILLATDGKADGTMKEMLRRAYDARLDLPIYAQALLGLSFDLINEDEKRDMIARNLKQYLKEDPENSTAYLELGNHGYWWCWYGSDFEAQATALKLFLKVEPTSDATRGLALYLYNNRISRTHWTSTRDTGLAIEALAEYCRKVEKRGEMYVNAYLTYFTDEEPIKAAGLELKVNRTISRVSEVVEDSTGRGASGRSLAQKRTKEVLTTLKDGDTVKAGETLEIRVDLDSKNDYEYILIEDRKGAGFEHLDGLSGWKNLGGGWAYVENREKKTAMFLREISRGAHSFTYRVRVETPGVIHVLPAKVEAMYAPRLRGNSDEIRLSVRHYTESGNKMHSGKSVIGKVAQ